MSVAKHLRPFLFLLAITALTPAAALAQPFTYTYFPSNTTISTPVTTDFAITGFSGGQYNEDTFAREFTGPSSPTVTIADGAVIPDGEIFNGSVVNVTGGTSSLFSYDHSTVNVHGGTVDSVLSFDSAVVNVYGGTVTYLAGQCQHVNVYAGTVGLEANSQTSYLGDPLGSCVVDVFGGDLVNGLNAYNDGVLNLRGGHLANPPMFVAEGGTLNIFGANLAAQLVDPNGALGYSIYTLSGQLADGSSIDGQTLHVRNDGVTYGHSTFNLINVPTPGAAGVLAMGGLLASRRRRR